MIHSEQLPAISFRSIVFGNNVVVEVFTDRLQFGKPGPKMSTGQRVALGAVTSGASVIFTGLDKKGSELTVIPLEIIDSIEVVARRAKDKAKHLSNAGVFPGRGNWKSSMVVLTFAGHSLEIPADSDEADSIRILISDFSASRKQQLGDSDPNSLGTSGIARESSTSGIADELKKLHDLRQLGALTDEEFDAQKSKLLGT
jgi:hypothetical protein